MEFDRSWGIQDRGDGRVLTARREPRLLFASSRIAAQSGRPVITLADGRDLIGPGATTDAALSWDVRRLSYRIDTSQKC